MADDTKTADPLIYVDPGTGRLFNFDLTLPCSVIWHSDDRGDTFGQGLACNHTDHQTLFAGPPPEGGAQPSGYPNVVYYCAIDGGASVAAGITACSKSLDGGVTFTRTGSAPYVTDFSKTDGGSMGIPGFCYGATGHGRVGPDGTVYVPRGMCGTPTLAISRDEGDTWEQVEIGKELGMEIGGDLEEHEARVAIDSSLNVYYFWVARDHLPYLAVSRDGGRTFGKPMMVAPPGLKEAMLPAVAVGDDGRVAFSYLGTRNSPGGPFCVRTTTSGCVTADGSAGAQPRRVRADDLGRLHRHDGRGDRAPIRSSTRRRSTTRRTRCTAATAAASPAAPRTSSTTWSSAATGRRGRRSWTAR